MNIINIGHNYHIKGGSDSYLMYLNDMLVSKGHRSLPFVAENENNKPSELTEYFPPGGGEGDILSYFYNRRAKSSLKSILNTVYKPDVAHLHIYYGKLTTSILDALVSNNVPIVQSLHEYKLACPVYTMSCRGDVCNKCEGKYFYRATLNKCKDNSYIKSLAVTLESYFSRLNGDISKVDRFIAVSHFMKKKMVESGVPKGKISVVHNFVDTERFQMRQVIPSNSYYLYFGRLEENKGILTLIDACKKAGVHLKVVGHGSLSNEVERLISDGTNRIEYLGSLYGDELIEVIQGAKATVIPSEWYENCPMSVLESLSLGVPVIGSSIGGIPELVDDGLNGFLFEPKSVSSLLSAFKKLDECDLVIMSMNARQSALNNYSKEIHYQKIMAIYELVKK